jgi:predicted naringenin-chalcone synthase
VPPVRRLFFLARQGSTATRVIGVRRLSFQIRGIGTAVPQYVMTQAEAMDMSAQLICRNPRETRLLETMFRRAGIEKRHTCIPHRAAFEWAGSAGGPSESAGRTTGERMRIYATHAGPLAVQAARCSLAASGIEASQITHLVTVSCTGFDAPGIGVQLIDQLAIRRTAEQLHIGYMGCHGALNGLRAARGLVAVEPDARVLLCAVELCSLHYRFQWDSERVRGNALFADGAAALVGTAPAVDAPMVTASGSCILGDSRDSITWRIGDHGFEMTLSGQVPQLIGQQLSPWLSQWLAQQGLSPASIQGWAVHPGGPRILDAVQAALELDGEALSASRHILSQYGNMSSPTVLFVLRELQQRGASRPWVALGFGPGLTVEATLFR